jgi:hypothetical protein
MKIVTITSTAVRLVRVHVPEATDFSPLFFEKDLDSGSWYRIELFRMDAGPVDRTMLAFTPEEWKAMKLVSKDSG